MNCMCATPPAPTPAVRPHPRGPRRIECAPPLARAGKTARGPTQFFKRSRRPTPGERVPKDVAGLGVVGLLLQSVHLNSESGFRDRGLVLLGEMELALLLKTRAGVALTQGLELGPVLAQLLRETALRRNWAGPSGQLVLRAGRRRNLTPLEYLVEAVAFHCPAITNS
jgi:hypothetical protein